MELLNPRNDPKESGPQRNEFLELLAQWGELYAANYGKEPTEETFLTYRMGLADLLPKYLHEAFMVCLKENSFPPNVAEIRNAYERVVEKTAKTYFKGYESETPEDRIRDRAIWNKLMNDFWSTHEKNPSEPMPGLRWTENHGWQKRELSWSLDLQDLSIIARAKSKKAE